MTERQYDNMGFFAEVEALAQLTADDLGCEMCGAFNSLFLGILGTRAWFRCQDCGIEYGALIPAET